jgi:hypothetical protein
MSLVLGVPAAVLELNQKGLLERAFHDALYPALVYRAEALAEEWPATTGNQLFMSRPGLLPAIATPNTPGTDPTPQAIPFEQWIAELNQFTGSLDIDMPTAVTSNANLFLRFIHQLGLQAGQSINRIARNALFKSYLAGQTLTTAAILITDTSLQVAALSGFRDVVLPGTNVAPQPVSPAFPLPITVGATPVLANVVGAVPNDPADPDGPGVLILSAAIGTAFPATRNPVISKFAARIVRSSGGSSIDAIGPADTFVLQQAINAVGFLRNNNVQPHEDGFYHAHVSPLGNAQIFADPVFQRLNQSLPEHVIYKEGFIGTISGIMFFMNPESPTLTNVGPLTSTGASALYGKEIGAEVQNSAGTGVGRILLTGKGALYERWLNESQYTTEAGVTGKIGEFDVVNNAISILTERIRLVLRAPIDRLQQKVAATWSISTSFPVPSDVTAPSGPERFKRAIVLEFSQ